MGLAEQRIITNGKDVLIFPWCGDLAMNALLLMLRSMGLKAARDGIALSVADVSPEAVVSSLAQIARDPAMTDGVALAAMADNCLSEKYHSALDAPLLHADYASAKLECQGALTAAKRVLGLCSGRTC